MKVYRYECVMRTKAGDHLVTGLTHAGTMTVATTAAIAATLNAITGSGALVRLTVELADGRV